jgi:hypothetical protein
MPQSFGEDVHSPVVKLQAQSQSNHSPEAL